MKIDPYYQRQKCSPGTLVSSKVSFVRIFAGVRWRGGVKIMRVGWSKMAIFAYFARYVFRTFTSKATSIIRPPGTVVPSSGWASVLPVMFFRQPHLRGPSADRRETLTHDRNLAQKKQKIPKIWGVSSPQKKLGAKNMQKFRSFFFATSDFDCEYLRK